MSDNNNISSTDWLYGIGLSVAASVIGALSKLSIRKSYVMLLNPSAAAIVLEHQHHQRDRKLSDEDVDTSDLLSSLSPPNSVTLKRRRQAWALRACGFFGMSILNPVCGLLAMKYASPSITAPFSGLTLVWVVLLSESLVGEKPRLMQVVAASLIIVGEIIITIFGDHTNQSSLSVHEFREQYQDPKFVAYFVVLAMWIIFSVYLINFGSSWARRLCWGAIGGCFTGCQNFIKDFLALLSANGNTFEGASIDLYVMLFLAGFFCFSGLVFLTACMKRYDATYSASMYVGAFVISASVMSAIHYHTFDHLYKILNWIFYPTGILVLIAGTLILSLEFEIKDEVVRYSLQQQQSNTTTITSITPSDLEEVLNSETTASSILVIDEEEDSTRSSLSFV